MTSDSRIGFFSASDRANARGDHSSHATDTASNYNEPVVALRYVYVLALSIWFGGIITVGVIIAPISSVAVRRFYITSYIAGALVLSSLFAMALLGPRPSGFFARFAVAVGMLAVTLYAGLELRTLSITLLALTAIGGLASAFLGSARRHSAPHEPHTITLIPGDGIGPEVTDAVVGIIEAAGVGVTWDRHDAGVAAVEKHGTPLPETLLASIRRNRVALKGPVTTPVGEGFTSVNVGLRKALDLYANLRPVANLPHVRSRFEHVDLVIVRENTEDLYSGLEHEVVPGVVESLKIITERASTRIARFAFDYAKRMGRKRITAIHKANIMKMSDGLFIRCARSVAAEYPDIGYDEQIVDAACMNLVMKPEKFDVLLLPNLYGDIVSDLCAGLVGGLGTVGAANLGETWSRLRSRARQRAGYRGQEHRESDGAAAIGAPDAPAYRGVCGRRPYRGCALSRARDARADHSRSRREGVNQRVRACYSSGTSWCLTTSLKPCSRARTWHGTSAARTEDRTAASGSSHTSKS